MHSSMCVHADVFRVQKDDNVLMFKSKRLENASEGVHELPQSFSGSPGTQGNSRLSCNRPPLTQS